MGERNLPCHQGIAVGDVRRWIVESVFQLDVHPHAELLDIERGGTPIDADFLPDGRASSALKLARSVIFVLLSVNLGRPILGGVPGLAPSCGPAFWNDP
jgi:hypothetical protein